MNPRILEKTILNAVAKVKPDDWLACSVGDLRNRMGEIDANAANTTMNTIADAILFLAQDNALLVGKRQDGGKRLPLDVQRQLDHEYVSNFFGRGSFEIKLTHEGRKRTSPGLPETGSSESEDRQFARLAIEEARKSKPENDGRAHPLVGAVVVKDGKILARSHRGEADGNHAEYIALERKLSNASLAGATVYTTLEPCTTRNHPKIPCASRLIERKVRRVVIGMLDPDPRITGRGQRKLRSANIITDLFPHDLMSEVEDINRAFTRSFEEFTQSTELQRRPTWPQPLGVYTASSSETIPGFPSELSGYRFEASKDFWGKPFSENGSIRIFQGSGWQGIHKFPATMNGCSSGVFMIRWRSAYTEMPVESSLRSYNAVAEVDTKPPHGFGYMSGTNCEQPMFKFPDKPNPNGATLVDVYYELKFWRAAP